MLGDSQRQGQSAIAAAEILIKAHMRLDLYPSLKKTCWVAGQLTEAGTPCNRHSKRLAKSHVY